MPGSWHASFELPKNEDPASSAAFQLAYSDDADCGIELLGLTIVGSLSFSEYYITCR